MQILCFSCSPRRDRPSWQSFQAWRLLDYEIRRRCPRSASPHPVVLRGLAGAWRRSVQDVGDARNSK
uniref:Uncharacterized protein n=1 Tax=Arundo donax TaxID=35708 RepID=A0A0A9C7E9_ARUDO